MYDKSTSKDQLFETIKNIQSEIDFYKKISEEYASERYKNEERFSFVMQGTNDGLWDWDVISNNVYYSPRWKNMLGYHEDELLPHIDTWKQLVFEDDQEKWLTTLNHYLSGEDTIFEIEIRMRHKSGHCVFVLSRGVKVLDENKQPIRVIGTHVDISERKKSEAFDKQHTRILEMIAVGCPASDIYYSIALLYESCHPGLYCSMLELDNGTLLHGGAPSLPKEYCDAVHGLENGPNVGSCGTSTYTGERVLVEDIANDIKWEKIKHFALPHGLRSCWSQPIKSTTGKVLGAFGMYFKRTGLPNDQQLNDLVSGARLASIVMERDQNQKKIRELAYTDNLTKLASRAYFYQFIDELIKSCARHQHKFALMYIDLDNFKDVNDSLGHDIGDVMLKEVAQRLKSTCREIDFIARLSGDEFCILVNRVEGDYAANVAQRCLTEISQPIELEKRLLMPTCSVGIAHYPNDGENVSTLLKAADTSLYFAKAKGKNQYAFYKPEFTKEAEYRFLIEHSLRQAIENQTLWLEYQPQYHIKTGELVGVEALARWYHPQLGDIVPAEFIPIAERIGMIKPLTQWVLNTACRQAMDWVQAGFEPVMMAVNISPTHFLDEDFITLVVNTIQDTGISPEYLKLEVTEGVVQTDSKNLVVFKKLKFLGIQLAIDDFGTGYSSFASLKHLDVDCLKIDQCFIDDMLLNPHSQILVTSMINLGHQLGYGIIAEGVETEAQLLALKDLNCDIAQGYWFSRPISGDSVEQLLTQSVSSV